MAETPPSYESPTHALPRITFTKFESLLASKNSPATDEAAMIWEILLINNVDPSFALAHFRVESQYGTSGFAIETGSWGNMLYDPSLTTHSGTPQKEVVGGHTYVYATYDNYGDAVTDYCNYLAWYRDEYGLDTIYEATGRWLGLNRTGDSGHINYVNIIINDMILYEFKEGEFYETGDRMIVPGVNFNNTTGTVTKRIFVKRGTTLYRGTNGDRLKELSPATGLAGLDLRFMGLVQGSKDWGMVYVVSSGVGQWVYIQNPDLSTVKNA
jgi:hypothetical protein